MNIPKSKRKKALIIVDVQPVFLNKNNRHVVSNIKDLLNFFPYSLYINAVFHAPENSIWQKQINWNVTKNQAKTESSVRKILDKKENVINVTKQTKSVFKADFYDKSNTFNCSVEDILKDEQIEEIHIIGLDTNDCVLATAYEAFDLGFFTYVITECVQSSEGNEIHQKALDLLHHVGLTNKYTENF